MQNFFFRIRKFLNSVINHVGWDKLLHFTIGAWLTSIVSPLGLFWMIMMFIFVTLMSIVKEKYVDATVDKKDILSGMIGSLTSCFIFLLLKYFILI